jgi:hypothetical protein
MLRRRVILGTSFNLLRREGFLLTFFFLQTFNQSLLRSQLYCQDHPDQRREEDCYLCQDEY